MDTIERVANGEGPDFVTDVGYQGGLSSDGLAASVVRQGDVVRAIGSQIHQRCASCEIELEETQLYDPAPCSDLYFILRAKEGAPPNNIFDSTVLRV